MRRRQKTKLSKSLTFRNLYSNSGHKFNIMKKIRENEMDVTFTEKKDHLQQGGVGSQISNFSEDTGLNECSWGNNMSVELW